MSRTGTARNSSGRGRRCCGQRRCSRVNDGRPSASRATTSPSSTTARPPTAAAAEESSGNVNDTSEPLRENTITSPPAMITDARWPSNFHSTDHRSPRGGAPSVANMGPGVDRRRTTERAVVTYRRYSYAGVRPDFRSDRSTLPVSGACWDRRLERRAKLPYQDRRHVPGDARPGVGRALQVAYVDPAPAAGPPPSSGGKRRGSTKSGAIHGARRSCT